MKDLVYAIIPARSGSKGIVDKNISEIAEKPLLSYSINFAKHLNVDKIICSTDSQVYANIAKEYGADVPFLRSKDSSQDVSMEHDILQDLYTKFVQYQIPLPKYIVWLRPTFIFRDLDSVNKCLDELKNNPNVTSARTVCQTESRLYDVYDNHLFPTFNDGKKSMIRRQDVGNKYKVYSTDVFRFDKDNLHDDFLGRNVFAVEIDKICGMDIDDKIDFEIVKTLLENRKDLVSKYTWEE